MSLGPLGRGILNNTDCYDDEMSISNYVEAEPFYPFIFIVN
jgi:hypothetical protein